jgi:hypothetical protein
VEVLTRIESWRNSLEKQGNTNMRLRRSFAVTSMITGLLLASLPGRAEAALTLTPAALAQGFSLTTFATGFANTENIGPLGMAFTNGGVLVTSFPGDTYFFKSDTDNQVASAPTHFYGLSNAVGIAQNGSTIYMTQEANGAVVTVDSSGGQVGTIIPSGLIKPRDVIVNPTNGHLLVSNASSTLGIVDIDPVAKTFSTFEKIDSDGLTITPNGRTLYAAIETGTFAGHVLGFDTTTGSQVFDSGFIAGSPDGATLGFGTLAGNIFVNTNGGTLVEVNLTTSVQTILASGGSRGDFVDVDPNNDTLLLTQTDRILRLTPPPGGSFAVPEPSTLAMTGMAALIGLGASCRRGRRAVG